MFRPKLTVLAPTLVLLLTGIACETITMTCQYDRDCDDFNACTIDVCDPSAGCRHVANPDCHADGRTLLAPTPGDGAPATADDEATAPASDTAIPVGRDTPTLDVAPAVDVAIDPDVVSRRRAESAGRSP